MKLYAYLYNPCITRVYIASAFGQHPLLWIFFKKKIVHVHDFEPRNCSNHLHNVCVNIVLGLGWWKSCMSFVVRCAVFGTSASGSFQDVPRDARLSYEISFSTKLLQ